MDIKSDRLVYQKFINHALFVLIFLLLCRVIASYFIPLNDTTEARYGEIARKMLETGNWVNLLHDYGIPFWAKPPLSTWFSAVSMNLFGISEWAVRLPSLLLSIGILGLIWDLAKKHSGLEVALVSILVLSGMLFFFLEAGTVMTDPSLTFCCTLALVAFWHAMVTKSKLWSYGFFIGLGLGLLAKGPLVLILVGTPIFFWVLLRKQWRNLWNNLPWIKGTLLLFAIALPWYILAELRTPGFLNYFIVGEHFNRFLVPGWTGDKYGAAHHAPKGIIWIFAIAGIFPWNLVVGKWLISHAKNLPVLFRDEDGWLSYLVLCALTPLVFFTFSSNIIYPYVFPSLPAFALLFAEIWKRSNQLLINSQWIIRFSAINGVLFLIGTLLFMLKPDWIAKTQKPVINAWIKQHPTPGSNLVYWGDRTEFSAQFYSAGKVKSAQSVVGLCKLLSNGVDNYFVINSQIASQIPPKLFSQFTLVKTINYKQERMLLLHCPILNC
ncbi:ArnT family glycosyltransferase [Legionella fallonii]|uniref:Putative melitin resistence protein n=1 Tax=Legionella fallonii LLAP-10 TaxID=1212491 RepID=A0A098G962_9GAMM|nr:glycosyltransferase family 39 protein [Legionella fallonii]CEG58501.1 putative melitin resistence protein [Legionella fallonii LLAP-10]